jgi:hypothetical protein
MTQYIVDAADIAEVRAGTARINGKEVLIADGDMRTATRRIFAVLAKNPDLGIVSGLGLSTKSSTVGQYRRLSVPELEQLILDSFTLVREQLRGDGQCRLEILEGPPSKFWVVTLHQGRWLTDEVCSWFPPIIKQDKIKLITRP